MAEDTDKSEKTEPPSPFKLREAKNKGTVSKSNEVNATVAVIAGLLLVLGIGSLFINHVLTMSADLLSQAGQLQFTPHQLTRFFTHWTSEGIMVLSPVIAVMFVVGILATVVQTGFVFSTFPLKPDFKRLNPVEGIKKLFSIQIVYEVVRSVIKIAIFTLVIGWTIYERLDVIQLASVKSIQGVVPFYLDLVAVLLFRLVAVMLLFAVIDILFTRWQFMKKMRMSPKEVKDEIKRREGDPMIRARRRELEKELRQRSQSLSSVPSADMIVTNPTHYAVILQYDRQKMAAPHVTGKGAGEMARAIRQEAGKFGIPVISSPSLARALYRRVKVGQMIGREYFVDVARLLRQVYKERRMRAAT